MLCKNDNIIWATKRLCKAYLEWRYNTYEGDNYRNDVLHMDHRDSMFLAYKGNWDKAYKEHLDDIYSLMITDFKVVTDRMFIRNTFNVHRSEEMHYAWLIRDYVYFRFNLDHLVQTYERFFSFDDKHFPTWALGMTKDVYIKQSCRRISSLKYLKPSIF